MFKLKYFFLIAFIFPLSMILGNDIYDWEKNKDGNYQLKKNKEILYSSEKTDIQIPRHLSKDDQILSFLYISEYLLLNNEFEKLDSLIGKLDQNDSSTFSLKLILELLKDNLLDQKKVKSYYFDKITKLNSSDNYTQITRNIILYFFDSKSPFELNCNDQMKGFRLFCSFLDLNFNLKQLEKKNPENLTNIFSKINEIIPIIFENSSTKHIPFIELFLPNLVNNLSSLGFIYHSINLQKMIISTHLLAGKNTIYNKEKLSYLYTLTQNYQAAAEILSEIISEYSETDKAFKNSLNLRLGFLYFLNNQFKDSINTYLNLDFLSWSSNIKHPLTGKSISISLTRDLISLSIWKDKGHIAAIATLQNISEPTNFTEEELYIKIRIAQMMFEDNFATTEKILKNINSLSQSKGWKKSEFYSTVMLGFLYLKNEKLRKATIEFVKANGIIPENQKSNYPFWIRDLGEFLTLCTLNKNNISTSLVDKVESIILNQLNDPIMNEVINFLPNSINKTKVTETLTDYYDKINESEKKTKLKKSLESKNSKSNQNSNILFNEIYELNTNTSKYRGFTPFYEKSVNNIMVNSRNEFLKLK